MFSTGRNAIVRIQSQKAGRSFDVGFGYLIASKSGWLRRAEGTTKPAARHLLLQAATGLVVGTGVTAWTLDDQEANQKMRDRAAIAHALAGVDRRLHPVYDHRPSVSEPLLWAADAVCWAVGAGPDWRRRVQTITTITDIGS